MGLAKCFEWAVGKVVGRESSIRAVGMENSELTGLWEDISRYSDGDVFE